MAFECVIHIHTHTHTHTHPSHQLPQKRRPNARSPNGFPEEAAARTGSATCLEKSKLRGHALQLPGKLRLSFLFAPAPPNSMLGVPSGATAQACKKNARAGLPPTLNLGARGVTTPSAKT